MNYKKTNYFKMLLNVLSFLSLVVIVSLIFRNKIIDIEIDDYTPELMLEEVSINKYYIYGNHLNIEGSLKLETFNKEELSVELVLNTRFKDISIDVESSYKDGALEFKTSDLYNKGIELDSIKNGDYYFLLKISTETNDVKTSSYYNLKNNTEYRNMEYYSLTKNKVNTKINFSFDTSISKLSSIESVLPDDYYDVAIDPGHGGRDPGAVSLSQEYTESEIVLEIAYKLKKELEKEGFKVIVTRPEVDTLKYEKYPFYGPAGKVVIPNSSKSKLFISIHLNSAEVELAKGGVELYTIPNIDLEFSRKILSNIISDADTNYSTRTLDGVDGEDGIYITMFDEDSIQNGLRDAKILGYEPYTKTTDTVYHFMLRETGGILTGAYIDGRDDQYESNEFYDSNHVTESYLLELGYMVTPNDLKKLQFSQELYVGAITNAIIDNYNLKIEKLEVAE